MLDEPDCLICKEFNCRVKEWSVRRGWLTGRCDDGNDGRMLLKSCTFHWFVCFSFLPVFLFQKWKESPFWCPVWGYPKSIFSFFESSLPLTFLIQSHHSWPLFLFILKTRTILMSPCGVARLPDMIIPPCNLHRKPSNLILSFSRRG